MLSPIKSNDLVPILNAINESHNDLKNAMPWVNTNKKIKPQIISFVLESEIQNQTGEIHLWKIEDYIKNEFIGLIGVDKITHQGGDLNFGYWVKFNSQQKGIFSKVAPKVLHWLSKIHSNKKLEITVNPENTSGMGACKHIINHLNLNIHKYEITKLTHQKKEITYYTYLIPLGNIKWK